MKETTSTDDFSEISPLLLKYDSELVMKVFSPEYSLFENFQPKIPKINREMLLIFVLFFIIGLAFFISTIVITNEIIEDILLYTIMIILSLGFMLPCLIFVIRDLILAKKKLKSIRQLISNKDLNALHELYPNDISNMADFTYEKILTVFALLTLHDKKAIIDFTFFDFSKYWPRYKKTILQLMEVLAIQLKYNSVNEFEKKIWFERLETIEVIDDISIPITKAYIIPSLPKNTRCMISKTYVDSSNNLLICPFCLGFVKENLMKEWLEYKDHCPSCKRSLKIENCPIVVIKKEN